MDLDSLKEIYPDNQSTLDGYMDLIIMISEINSVKTVWNEILIMGQWIMGQIGTYGSAALVLATPLGVDPILGVLAYQNGVGLMADSEVNNRTYSVIDDLKHEVFTDIFSHPLYEYILPQDDVKVI